MRVAKLSAIVVGMASIVLALGAQKLNVAFLVSFAFAVAASANLPVLLFTLFWRKFNTYGAMSSIAAGLISSLLLMAIGPNVMDPKQAGFGQKRSSRSSIRASCRYRSDSRGHHRHLAVRQSQLYGPIQEDAGDRPCRSG